MFSDKQSPKKEDEKKETKEVVKEKESAVWTVSI